MCLPLWRVPQTTLYVQLPVASIHEGKPARPRSSPKCKWSPLQIWWYMFPARRSRELQWLTIFHRLPRPRETSPRCRCSAGHLSERWRCRTRWHYWRRRRRSLPDRFGVWAPNASHCLRCWRRHCPPSLDVSHHLAVLCLPHPLYSTQPVFMGQAHTSKYKNKLTYNVVVSTCILILTHVS